MTLPPRAVTVLGLIQVGLVMAGYLIVRTFVRVLEDHMSEIGISWFRMPGFTVFIRWFGLWFLLIPISWVVLASLEGDRDRPLGLVNWSSLKVGGLLTAALALFFAYGVFLAVQTYVNPLRVLPLQPVE